MNYTRFRPSASAVCPAIRVFVILLFLVAWCPVSFADDLADARAAFETLRTYQKTDDIRVLDLFAKDCLITFTIIDAINRYSVFVPADAYRDLLRKAIALKQGDKDSYEDVKCSQDGYMVKVTAVIHHLDTDKRGPFTALYARDADGVLRIKEMKVTACQPERTEKAASP